MQARLAALCVFTAMLPYRRNVVSGFQFMRVHRRNRVTRENFSLSSLRESASGELTVALQKASFIVVQFTPLASQFPHTKTSYLKLPKRQMPKQFPVTGRLRLPSPPKTKFCIGFEPLGNSQIRFTYFKDTGHKRK